MIKSSKISLWKAIEGVLKEDKLNWSLINNSKLITQWFNFISSEFLKLKKKEEKESEISHIKSLSAVFPFSYNWKIYRIESSLKWVDPSLKNATDLKKILKNGFITTVKIWNKVINFTLSNSKSLITNLYDSYKEIVWWDKDFAYFITNLLKYGITSNNINILEEVFLPNLDSRESENSLRIIKNDSDDDLKFSIEDSLWEKYLLLDIMLWYSKIKKGYVWILNKNKDLNEIFEEKLSNNNPVQLKKLIKEIKTQLIYDGILYEIYDKDENIAKEITEEANNSPLEIDFEDFYFIWKKGWDDSIYCIRFEKETRYIIYKYCSSDTLNEVLKKDISTMKDYCDVFLDDFSYISNLKFNNNGQDLKDNKNYLKTLITKELEDIKNNEDLITLSIAEKLWCEYIFSWKWDSESEIADLIHFKEESNTNTLWLFHFKIDPFKVWNFRWNPWYTNINIVIWQMLQKTFFLNKKNYEFALDFKWKDTIESFLQNKKDRHFILYNNEKFSNLFKYDNTTSAWIGAWKKKINPEQSNKNAEKRNSIWLQYYYVNNILNSDIKNFSFENWKLTTQFITIITVDKDIYKKIHWETSQEYKKYFEWKNDNHTLLIQFKIWEFIHGKLYNK